MFLSAVAPACRAPDGGVIEGESAVSCLPDEHPVDGAEVADAQVKIRIIEAARDPKRWLFVERLRKGSPGRWATGVFYRDRNKVEIATNDAERFAVDTSRIPINWDRLVVLGIDGRNAELKKRDYDVIHFALDEHGRWNVVEP